ncbi:MAG TPA: hypothetical protein VJT49_07130 [Amycolatopsis sp.]|nr:hypothetical protein [Amycolatopsis sp.]HKS44880.1 hypothetical protein [Amycolatopsis sp.]
MLDAKVPQLVAQGGHLVFGRAQGIEPGDDIAVGGSLPTALDLRHLGVGPAESVRQFDSGQSGALSAVAQLVNELPAAFLESGHSLPVVQSR